MEQMNRRSFLKLAAAASGALAWSAPAPAPAFAAQTTAEAGIKLPPPRTGGGKPLFEALAQRRSTRAYANQPLNLETLSSLLWAAWGVNRADGRRTAPSARNFQEIDLYPLTAQGAYLYQPKEHQLQLISQADLRALSARQAFAAQAPLNLLYVADSSRQEGGAAEDNRHYAWADTGFISQNVYLFCASENLATVVRASIDRQALAQALELKPSQHITLCQSVGLPAGA